MAQAFDPYYNKTSTTSPEGEAEEISQRYFERPAFTTGYPDMEAMPTANRGNIGAAFDPSAMTTLTGPFTGQGGEGGGAWNPATQSIANQAIKLGGMGISNALGGLSGYGVNSVATNLMATTVGQMFTNIGAEGSGAPSWLNSTVGSIPFLGPILLNLGFGGRKQSESPYTYYDPKTRGYGQGTQLGEPIDQFGSASKMWSDVYSNLVERTGGKYPDPFAIGVKVEDFPGLNPAEQKIFENYNALFNKEANPTLGGPSPYMEYLASQGR